MRSNLWASGYDVDGTDQTSLGQFSGRVQQTYKHSVPRFFVPEHGTMFTLALVRFPPTATKLFFFSSRRRHTRSLCDWSSDVCSSDLRYPVAGAGDGDRLRSNNRVSGGKPHQRVKGGMGMRKGVRSLSAAAAGVLTGLAVLDRKSVV